VEGSPNAEGSKGSKSIGHYLLGKTIGEGTFGKVKLGRHVLSGERVAVKILVKERIVEVADVERIAREVHILKLIRHPHIVQLYEIIETRGQLYLIMEYASGGELFDYIVANGRVQEPEACKFFHQIMAGVEKIHAMHVVHRDLKPENLLLDAHKNIKIVDFGLSNVFPENQLLKTACGSPCYAPPEMVAGHNYVPPLCDLWSCGVILFALVCGYLPFEDQNTASLYRKILEADYQAPPFISDSVKDLIGGLLTADPSRRFTVDRVRAHPWYRQIQEASIQPRDLVPGEQGLDEEVLCELDAFGFPREQIVRCLELNKHNHATTTYYLLAAKKRSGTNRELEGKDGAEEEEVLSESERSNDLTPGGDAGRSRRVEAAAAQRRAAVVGGTPSAHGSETDGVGHPTHAAGIDERLRRPSYGVTGPVHAASRGRAPVHYVSVHGPAPAA
jgi:5'-AMP-activated protein kinase catalytic alpha subunit